MEIALKKEREDGEMCALITVRDFGPGVPEAALEKLFLPFYRIEEARDRQSGGTGIGLAITERAVRLHRGEITARNLADGLKVETRLPIAAGSGNQAAP